MLKCLMLVKIQLQSADGLHAAQIQHRPFARISAGCRPVGAHALVRQVAGFINAVGRRYGYRLAIRQQHPARKTVGRPLDVGRFRPVGIIAESGGRVHHAVLVKRHRIKPDAAFKLILQRKHAGSHMPVVALHVAERAAMS